MNELEYNSANLKKAFNDITDALSDPLIIEPFYKDFKYAFCWSSNAIEGNTLSLDDTITFLEYNEVKSGHTFTEYEEAKALNIAINEFLALDGREMDYELIQNINSTITGDAKGYRKENVYIGNMIEAIYYPPDYSKIPEAMDAFLDGLNFQSNDIDEVISMTAKKHIEFERIHPFKDGNGRSGRIILNQCLINNGLLPIVIEPRSKYQQAFKRFDRNGDTSLMEYIIYKGEMAAIEKIELLREKTNEIQPKFDTQKPVSQKQEFLQQQKEVLDDKEKDK